MNYINHIIKKLKFGLSCYITGTLFFINAFFPKVFYSQGEILLTHMNKIMKRERTDTNLKK